MPYANNKITNESLEHDVDQLWSAILSHVFPCSKGYPVMQLGPIDHQEHRKPDIIVKYLKGGRDYIILTMENKRPRMLENADGWKQACDQLQRYLAKEVILSASHPSIPQYGLTAIGKHVWFYKVKRRSHGSLEEYESEDNGLEVYNDREKVLRKLLTVRQIVEENIL